MLKQEHKVSQTHFIHTYISRATGGAKASWVALN